VRRARTDNGPYVNARVAQDLPQGIPPMFAIGVDDKWRFSEEFARGLMAWYSTP
jgi:hypothetical protein